jgi:adenylate kinase
MSVGQMLRDRQDPELEKIMKTGALVPDELVVKMMHEGMVEAEEAGKGVILDGYPRDEWQAEWIVKNGDTQYLDGAIIFDVSHEELKKRLTLRGREDDNDEAIEQRWALFDRTIKTMSELLESKGVKIAHIDGVGEIEEISGRIEKQLKDWGIIE